MKENFEIKLEKYIKEYGEVEDEEEKQKQINKLKELQTTILQLKENSHEKKVSLENLKTILNFEIEEYNQNQYIEDIKPILN